MEVGGTENKNVWLKLPAISKKKRKYNTIIKLFDVNKEMVNYYKKFSSPFYSCQLLNIGLIDEKM